MFRAEAYSAITEEDAIMDEGVFEHLKKFTSYKYSQHKRKSRHQQLQVAALLQARTDALEKLVGEILDLTAQLAECDEELRRQLQEPADFASEERLRQKRQEIQRRITDLRNEQTQTCQQLQLLKQKRQRALLSDFAAIRKINNVRPFAARWAAPLCTCLCPLL